MGQNGDCDYQGTSALIWQTPRLTESQEKEKPLKVFRCFSFSWDPVCPADPFWRARPSLSVPTRWESCHSTWPRRRHESSVAWSRYIAVNLQPLRPRSERINPLLLRLFQRPLQHHCVAEAPQSCRVFVSHSGTVNPAAGFLWKHFLIYHGSPSTQQNPKPQIESWEEFLRRFQFVKKHEKQLTAVAWWLLCGILTVFIKILFHRGTAIVQYSTIRGN